MFCFRSHTKKRKTFVKINRTLLYFSCFKHFYLELFPYYELKLICEKKNECLCHVMSTHNSTVSRQYHPTGRPVKSQTSLHKQIVQWAMHIYFIMVKVDWILINSHGKRKNGQKNKEHRLSFEKVWAEHIEQTSSRSGHRQQMI